MVESQTLKRRWFQFSLRTLLLLVTLCAIPCSWLAVNLREAERKQAAARELYAAQEKLEKPIRDLEGRVFFGCQNVTNGDSVCFLGCPVTDAELASIKWWPKVKGLTLAGTKITDAGLVTIKGLGQLKSLSLAETAITDAGLANIAGLAQLECLDLHSTKLTDAGLEHFKRLTRLKSLDVTGTHVTAAGLAKFRKALPNCEIYQ